MNGDDVAVLLKKRLTTLTAITGILVVAVASLAIYNFTQQSKTHDGLCNLRAQIVDRVDVSKDFLIDNPKGIAGIPASAIKQGIQRDEKVIKALEPLGC